jgi:hypothetical protein
MVKKRSGLLHFILLPGTHVNVLNCNALCTTLFTAGDFAAFLAFAVAANSNVSDTRANVGSDFPPISNHPLASREGRNHRHASKLCPSLQHS